MDECFVGLLGTWGMEGGQRLLLDGPDEVGLYRALREKKGILLPPPLGTLRVHGKDAADFLQRMTSQDCMGMEVGAGGTACLLNGKGKLLAFFDIFREGEQAFLLLGQGELMPKVREHLDLYLFREEMELGPLERPCALGLFGKALAREAEGVEEFRLRRDGPFLWLGLGGWVVPGLLLVGEGHEVRAFLDASLGEGVPYGGVQAWEGLRIDSRLPRYGVDADESNLPLEVRLDAACHPDKGCYVGQEVVARIRNLGHVNRLLCLLSGESEEVPGKGSLLFDEDIEAGRVTSAFRVPGRSAVHLLALLPLVLSEAGTRLNLGREDGPPFEVIEPGGRG